MDSFRHHRYWRHCYRHAAGVSRRRTVTCGCSTCCLRCASRARHALSSTCSGRDIRARSRNGVSCSGFRCSPCTARSASRARRCAGTPAFCAVPRRRDSGTSLSGLQNGKSGRGQVLRRLRTLLPGARASGSCSDCAWSSHRARRSTRSTHRARCGTCRPACSARTRRPSGFARSGRHRARNVRAAQARSLRGVASFAGSHRPERIRGCPYLRFFEGGRFGSALQPPAHASYGFRYQQGSHTSQDHAGRDCRTASDCSGSCIAHPSRSCSGRAATYHCGRTRTGSNCRTSACSCSGRSARTSCSGCLCEFAWPTCRPASSLRFICADVLGRGTFGLLCSACHSCRPASGSAGFSDGHDASLVHRG